MTSPTVTEDLRLAAAAIEGGRVRAIDAWWRLGLALQSAADRALVRENIPVLVHGSLVALGRAFTALSSTPTEADAQELADRLWLIADCVEGLARDIPAPAGDAVPTAEDFFP